MDTGYILLIVLGCLVLLVAILGGIYAFIYVTKIRPHQQREPREGVYPQDRVLKVCGKHVYWLKKDEVK